MSDSPEDKPYVMPTTPEEDVGKTPEEIERWWYDNIYQGNKMRQLTVRAVVMGMLIGMIMACSNLYVGLKAGWSLGVAITVCVLAFSLFQVLHNLFPKWFPEFTILENNAMQSAAAAAGSISAAGISNALPALLMLKPDALPMDFLHRCLYVTPWIIVVTWLGVFLAVPTKRQLINIEKLPFPSGIAAAATMRALHEKGGAAMRQAKALGFAALGAAIIKWVNSADAPWLKWYPKIPDNWGTSWLHVRGFAFDKLTMSFEGTPLFVAAGAIMSFRQTWSMLLGASVNYLILAPIMIDNGVIPQATFKFITTRFGLWIGVPMMLTSGLLLFALNWRAVVRAFSSITKVFGKDAPSTSPEMDAIEVPSSWFLTGFVILGLAAVVIGSMVFHIAWWMGMIAVCASFFLVVVAGRATGETDVTPVGPLSKITQLTFGAIRPGSVTINLMTANITAGSTTAAGDLLTDLKSGYILGANPRQQFLAQFFGVFAGGLIAVPMYFLMVPDATKLPNTQFAAPAALTWRGVAEFLANGIHSLHPYARIGLAIGASLGIILPLLEMWLPRWKKFIPAATGLGLAFTLTGSNSIMMFIGALVALLWTKMKPKSANEYIVPVSSGIIAGESLMGVLVILLQVLKVLET